MFTIKEKMSLAEKIQELLQEMDHPLLPPKGNIHFHLHVNGRNPIDFCDINNIVLRKPSTPVSLKKKLEPKLYGNPSFIRLEPDLEIL